MKKINLVLDEDDDYAVQEAIAVRQQCPRTKEGALFPDGESNLPGAIIAEICRAFVDYRRENKAMKEEF